MPRKTAKKTAAYDNPLEKALIEHMPPHSLEAEMGVVGAILIDPLICDDVATMLRADDFYSEPNKRLFKHLLDLHNAGSGIDLTLLVNKLEAAGDLEEIGGEAYIGEVMGQVHVAAHAPHYAEIVRDKAILRDLIHTSAEILRCAYEPTQNPRDIVNQSEEKIFALSDSRSKNQVHPMSSVVTETLSILHMRNEGATDGVSTGFIDFDSMTGGLHPGELVILAARPSMGKTALATNIADYCAVEQNTPTLLVSLEMARVELAMRMICSRGRI
ncbi:MAG: replicative DNA helicase, partial [Thermoguttaceae bacterium]